MTTAEASQRLRKLLAWTQADLAAHLNVAVYVVRRHETGQRQPKPATLLKLAALCSQPDGNAELHALRTVFLAARHARIVAQTRKLGSPGTASSVSVAELHMLYSGCAALHRRLRALHCAAEDSQSQRLADELVRYAEDCLRVLGPYLNIGLPKAR